MNRPDAEIEYILYDSTSLLSIPEVTFSSGEFIQFEVDSVEIQDVTFA